MCAYGVLRRRVDRTKYKTAPTAIVPAAAATMASGLTHVRSAGAATSLLVNCT